MIRLLAWLIHWLGPKTIICVTFLMVAFASVGLGLADAMRGLNTSLLLPIAALGLAIGWWLAKSPVPGWLGGLLALALGIEVIFLRVGRLGKPLAASLQVLVESSFEFIVFLIRGNWGVGHTGEQLGNLPDGAPILLAVEDLWVDVGTMLIRLFDWWLAWVMGRPTFDTVAVALTWGLILWTVAVWAGWWVRRRNQPLPGMVPAGVLLGASLFFWRGDLSFLLSLLGATLFLVVLIGQDTRERRWTATGIDFPFDVGWEVKLAGAGLSLALVSLAIVVPSISWRQVVDWAGRLVSGQPRTVQVVAGPRGPYADASSPATIFDEDRVRAPGLPRRHLIGSGSELSEHVVMVIYVEVNEGAGDELTPSPSGSIADVSAPRYYWRSLTYNEYTGYGWITDETQLLAYRAGDLAVYRDPFEPLGVNVQPALSIPPGRKKVRTQVRAVSDLGELLHAAGDLVTVDQSFRVAWRSSEDVFGATIIKVEQALISGTALPERVGRRPGQDTPFAGLSVATLEGLPTIYQTDSLIATVGEVQLRAAGSDYPAWVQDRYLALPDRVPARVLALARDLTATEPTAYDRARAIEAYLRTFPYSLDLPSPKLDRDVVDYFLFDLQQGYCDYYATSMVVLARAAGLPARLAVGYSTGVYDEVNRRYVVTEADAHAWVEIFFPGYGWIEFEPTAGVPPIHRPPDVPPAVPLELEATQPITAGSAEESWLWWLALLGMVTFLALVGLIRLVVDSWRLRRMPPEGTAAALYRRLHRHGRRLAVSVQPGDTPFEYLASLVGHLGDAAENRLAAAVLDRAIQDARWLVGLYVRTCYGPRSPDATDQRQAIQAWRRLGWRLRIAWVCQVWDSVWHLTSAFSGSMRRAGHRPAG